jgi:hypothetical protein
MFLCQVNISEILYPVKDPRFLKFAAGVRVINRKVKLAKGYICGSQIYDGDKLFITRSVWKSPEDIASFIYSGTHQKFMSRASTWFKENHKPSVALWFSPDSALPEIEVCHDKLNQLAEHGESDNLKGVEWLSKYA